MLKSPYLFAVSVLVTLINWTNPAYAQEIRYELSFDLPPAKSAVVKDEVRSKPHIEESNQINKTENSESAIADLRYPTNELPPIVSSTQPSEAIQSIHSKNGDTVDVALTFRADAISLDSDSKQFPLEQISLEQNNLKESTSGENPASPFEVVSTEKISASAVLDEPIAVAFESFDGWQLDDWIFENGSNSLVARTVGSAEGTRYANGRRTAAYFGHTDPGNGVWNLGTFSYQHEAASPEEADEKQLRRLKRQGLQLEAKAKEMGISLSLIEKLNGLDLANQAPLAALDKGGYIERLVQARRLNMQEEEAILWARTYAYIDPNTRQWNAPGLGNNVQSISRDQERRMSAIAEALKAYDHYSIEVSAVESLENITLELATSLFEPATEALNSTPIPVANSQFNAARYLSSASRTTNLEVSFDLPAANSHLSSHALTTAALNTLGNEGKEASIIRSTPEQTPGQTPLDEGYLPSDLNTEIEIETNGSDATEDIGVAFMPSMPSQVLATASARRTTQAVEAPSVDSASTIEAEASEDLFSMYQSPDNSSPTELTAKTDSSPAAEASSLQSLIEGIADEKQITEEERDRLLTTKLTTDKSANSSPSHSQSKTNPLPDSQNSSASPNSPSDITLWRTEDKVLQTK